MATLHDAAASGKNEAPTATAQADRLLTFREVNRLIGSACKTSHTARTLAARGQIKVVRLNERLMRFSEASVRDLIAGRVDPVARGQVIPVDDLEAELAAIEAHPDLTTEGKHLLKREARERAAANQKGAPLA
jgi:hypothetical protein